MAAWSCVDICLFMFINMVLLVVGYNAVMVTHVNEIFSELSLKCTDP